MEKQHFAFSKESAFKGAEVSFAGTNEYLKEILASDMEYDDRIHEAPEVSDEEHEE